MSKYVDTVQTEQMASKIWNEQPAVRVEFAGNKGAYIAYWRAVARGQTPALSYKAPAAAPGRQLEQRQEAARIEQAKVFRYV